MKKIIVIGLTLFCVVLGGCKNKNKVCECKQLDDEYIPLLSVDSYNTCYAVWANFVYNTSTDYELYTQYYPNPNESHYGDTVKVSGFLRSTIKNNRIVSCNNGEYWFATLTDDSLNAADPFIKNYDIFIVGAENTQITDTLERCYIIGYYDKHNSYKCSFGDWYEYPEYSNSNSFDCEWICGPYTPIFHVIDIHK